MRRILSGTLLALLAACGPSSSSGNDAGIKEGVSPCSGATLLTQTSTINGIASTAEVFTAKGPVVLFGPLVGSSTASLTGYFQIGGYKEGESVKAQIVEYDACATTNCPAGFDFSMTGPLGDDVFSNPGSCGSATFTVGKSGTLTPSVAAGSPDGTNVGLLLTPQ